MLSPGRQDGSDAARASNGHTDVSEGERFGASDRSDRRLSELPLLHARGGETGMKSVSDCQIQKPHITHSYSNDTSYSPSTTVMIPKRIVSCLKF